MVDRLTIAEAIYRQCAKELRQLMSNDLLVEIFCPEFSEYPRIILPVDLDKARDGVARIEWTSSMAPVAVQALSEVIDLHPVSDGP